MRLMSNFLKQKTSVYFSTKEVNGEVNGGQPPAKVGKMSGEGDRYILFKDRIFKLDFFRQFTNMFYL